MKRTTLIIMLILMGYSGIYAQSRKTENLIVITLDGYRWQEVFTGADPWLIVNKEYTGDPKASMQQFWAYTPEQRREKLMPFFESTIVKEGQVYGNRETGNKVNVTNPYWGSYPGYNEIFTGFPDKKIFTNRYPSNPNINVLEFINKQKGFQGKVAAFTSWQAFPRILNEKRCGFPVNAGFEDVKKNLNGQPLTDVQQVLNRLQHALPHYMGEERMDGLTFEMALEYLKVNQPKVLYISFGDPDGLAHHGDYGRYLQSAHYIDQMIGRLWDYLQSHAKYKNKTTLFITTDHGRGLEDDWRNHAPDVEHSDEIWFAVMGPDTEAKGIVKTEEQWYQKQFAQTFAHFLGFHFQTERPVGERIEPVINIKH